ncbi:MAG: hypothetical protein WC178_03260 [Candidatus Paceibacterota bacterium]
MKRSRLIIIIFSLLYLILVSVLFFKYSDIKKNSIDKPEAFSREARVYCWDKDDKTFAREEQNEFAEVFLSPKSGTESHTQADLDGNLIMEKYDFQNGKLTISENYKIIWQSEDDWRVEDFILADSNNDGITDINMSVWKSGDFGDFKPLWVEENDMSIKNHFFIFDFKDGEVRPIWQSSNLDAPNCQILISDMDDDSQNELVVIEGDYADSPDCKGKYLAVWKWNEWGFFNEWRSEAGVFDGVETYEVGGENCFVGF